MKGRNSDDHERYKQYRSALQKIKRRAKCDFYTSQCIKFKNDSKRLWKTINNVTKGHNDKSTIIDCIKIGNIKISDTKLISNEFGKYFSTIGEKIATKGGNSTHEIHHYLNKILLNDASVFLTPCTTIELLKLINKLLNKLSSGYDDISNMLLKEIFPQIMEPLLSIFNDSLLQGTFPDAMKQADVVPLYKNGTRQILSNFRPISLLPAISKLLGKVMYDRIYNFLCHFDLLYKSQYSFRKKHSCEHAVTELLGEICKGLENNKHTISLFIDLSKAFDTISHDIFIQKLERYGIPGTVLNWFKSYLMNRTMRAKCTASSSRNMAYSEKYNINIGCLQGSCIGPLIFLIFCNDLYLNLELCNGILFADGMTIYKSHSNIEYLKWCMTNDLEIISDWFRVNQLSVNSNKSVAMIFSNKQIHLKSIKMGPNDIQFIDSTKFLEVFIDRKLTWTEHVEKVIQKINRNMNLLKLSNKFLNVHAKRLIYFAQIQSHLMYGLSVWGNMIPNGTIEKLQKLQNRCLNYINGQTADKVNYYKLNILRVKDLIVLENCKYGYKVLNNLLLP